MKPLRKRGRHVQADIGDLIDTAAMGLQIGSEGMDGSGVLALDSEEHLGDIQVSEDRHVPMAPSAARLVDFPRL